MGSKKRKEDSKEEGKEMITDPRFSSAHTDPRFRRVPRRESKVTIDSRFKGALTDKRFVTGSAPVDKRGKRKKKGTSKDSLNAFYRIDEEEEKKEKECEEEESEKELELKLASSSSDEEEEEEEESDEEVSEEEEEMDTDEEDGVDYEDESEVEEEKIEQIEKETHRLAIVNMDWRHVSAKDLYVVLNSFLPKEGRLVSVAVYPSDFGLERMKEEETHGPAIDGDEKKEDGEEEDEEEDEEEEDEEEINQKVREYEISRLKYYHAVAVCDSSATADFLYKSCDGIEFERSSNKLDLRFIPDSMEFKHPPRDIATEAPAKYEGLDFQSRALQMSKVNLSWDEDEPHRIKTLSQKFNNDQLAERELMEYLASDSDESESDEDNSEEGIDQSKEEKRKEKYRALFDKSGDVDSDNDEEENDNDHDMEVTFDTSLDDLSKKILEKKNEKPETVWEKTQRKVRENKRARKNQKNDDSSSPDDDEEGDDDFFMEEPPHKKKKKEDKKKNKKKKQLEEEVAADERSRAELELLLADESAGDGLKGYNIKRKAKKANKEIAEEKIPSAEEDPRFSALFTSPLYALDPTDPQFKRSATYVRQVAQKQKSDPESYGEVEATTREVKPDDGNLKGKKKDHEMFSAIKSLKVKMQQKNMDKKKAENASSSSTLSQKVKKTARKLSNK